MRNSREEHIPVGWLNSVLRAIRGFGCAVRILPTYVGVSIGSMLSARHWPMNSLPESRKAGKVSSLSK